ncbi:MAG: sigma-54-dependent Fis family transcriptional regulator, partial [Oligoflexales bacterium]|nr:sigma-54-dependent Fis family transcriptional regulator [Oligoflexales bacterium]
MRELNSDIPVVIMSGHASIETAVRSTKLGAFDFLEKPLSLEKLLPMLDHAKEIKSVRQKKMQPQNSQYQMIGESDIIAQVRRQIKLVAPRNAWVLITGENGTGKEILANCIHNESSRAKKPFIAVNCAAIPEQLIESELFGHTKGAFTNAFAAKRGKFELAHQGTLFLDEIGDMSLQTQAKILRILQEQTFERVGGTDIIQVDVRVIAATNKDLREEILKGNFREDLYYRLNVVPFQLPPLRERGEDVLLLADHFLSMMALDLGENKKYLSSYAKNAFLSHNWPGNIRELKNILERICIIIPNKEEISMDDLVLSGFVSSCVSEARTPLCEAETLKEAKNNFEKAFILDKLEENQWNVTKTAEAIGIERSNLHKKLKTYDIDLKRLKG